MDNAPLTTGASNDHFVIIVSAIVALGIAFVPVIVLLIRVLAKTDRVRDQVENGHDTNLRHEADVRHDENGSKLDTALSMIDNVQKSQGRLYDLLAATILRVDDLDDRTQNDHPKPLQEKP